MIYTDTKKTAVLDIIAKEPVEETEDVISAFTLFNAIREQKRRLSCMGEVEKGLLDKLNDIYPKEEIKGKRKLFKKAPITVKNYFDIIGHGFICEDRERKIPGKSSISLKVRDGNYAITIFKKFNKKDTCSLEKRRLESEAYEQCEDDIQKILSTIEYYGELFSSDVNTDNREKSILTNDGNLLSNKFSYREFDLSISFDRTSCRFDYSYGLNEDIDPLACSYKTYYGSENTLGNFIVENEEDILKNIPINMGDLSLMFATIVYDYRNKEARKREEEIAKEQEKLMIKIFNKLKINED